MISPGNSRRAQRQSGGSADEARAHDRDALDGHPYSTIDKPVQVRPYGTSKDLL